MKQVTKRLLKYRPGSVHIPKVTQDPHPEAKYQSCVDNALDESNRSGNYYTMGWLVSPYHKDSDSTGVCFHFWNVDKMGNHYDVTPFRGDVSEYEYVWDDEMEEESWAWSDLHQKELIHYPPALKFKSDRVLVDVSEAATQHDFTIPCKWITLSSDVEQFYITQLLNLRQDFKDNGLTNYPKCATI